jgi:serine/threonine protein kinase
MRIDALVAEIFTSSPRIVDIYGYCGTTMINQAMMQGRMYEIALQHDGDHDYRDELIEQLEEEDELVVLNDLSGTQKLEYALEMAEAVLLLHSYPGGVIVHDDVTLEQFLLGDDGSVKLNDFNRAEFMLWNDEDQEYCRYRNNPGNGLVGSSKMQGQLSTSPCRAFLFSPSPFSNMQWRAPEEYADKPLNEMIDIWSLGNNFFALLTGLQPFYNEDTLNQLVMDGETAYIDPRFHDRSYGERTLTEIIPLCWKFNPDDRIDIFEMVNRLRQAVDENRRHRSLRVVSTSAVL